MFFSLRRLLVLLFILAFAGVAVGKLCKANSDCPGDQVCSPENDMGMEIWECNTAPLEDKVMAAQDPLHNAQ